MLPAGTTIATYVSPTQITVSAGATVAETGAPAFIGWGTNDLTALNAAAAIGPVFLPPGGYYTGQSLFLTGGNKQFGSGAGGALITLEGTGAQKQANRLSYITSPPSPPLNGFWNGDFSNVQVQLQTYVTGATTLTKPTTTYYTSYVTTPLVAQVYNSSGWQEQVLGNGRTATYFGHIGLTQAGQGDMIGLNITGTVSGQNAVTPITWLGSPTIGFGNADFTAGASNVYIDLLEMNIHDGGFDISAAGFVLNMFRTNSTAAIGQPWMGHRVVGWTNAIDAAFSMGGNMRIGADFVTASFVDGSSTPTRAAMTLKNGQALFGNATNFVQNSLPGATQFGTELFGWRDAVGWELVANSSTILSVTQAGATATTIGASGSLGSSTTAFGVTVQARDGIVAKTAVVNTIAPIGRGGAFASIPTLVVAAPPGSGTQATAVVATMGLSRQSYTNIGGVSGGTGYAVGDVLTLSGGTFGTAAQITVASVAGTSVNSSTGAVQTYTLTTVGSYTVLPTSPITLSGGTGTGAKLQGLWKILTVTVTGAGSNYPEFPPPAVTTSGGSPLTNYDCAFTTTMTATQQPLTIGGGANVALMAAGSYGGGTGVVFIANDSVDPTTNPVGGGILYVKAGALTYRGSSGTVTVLGPA
ncbi:MAG TPA: hypothetical protein VN702_17625 [Acetobacteraceae bacterium]|nr:hypothetical protein [Acetobacteraceae bacterium]